jgi:hypothetical protein
MKYLLIVLLSLQGTFSKAHAQRFDIPSMDFLKSSIDSFYRQKAEAEILEFREAGRGRWLNYIPSPGWSVITGFSVNFNLTAPIQEAKARNQNKSRVAAIRRVNLLEAEQTGQECRRDLESLKMAVNAFQAGTTVDSLQTKLFQLSMQQYDRQEMTPTEFLNRKAANENYNISRLAAANGIRNQILNLLSKSHAPAWTFEKVVQLTLK